MKHQEYIEKLYAKLVPESMRAAQEVVADQVEEDDDVGTSFLHLRVGSEQFAIPIGYVEEVISIPELTALPGVTDRVLGIFQHRGILVPLLDTRQLVGVPGERESGPSERVIVLGGADETIGLLVSEVFGVAYIPHPEQQALPREELRFVSRSGRIEGNLVGLLDVDALFSLTTTSVLIGEER